MRRRSRWLVLWIVMLLLAGAALPAQAQSASVSIAVQAGYDGLFRENHWLPLYLQVSNDGSPVEGRLLVRPETSGSAVNNAYSIPISLPEGARQTAFLYINARSFATQVRVELMNDDGVVIASAGAGLRAVQPQDRLYVVISGAAAGTVDLSSVRAAGYGGFQANWTLDNLPGRAAALSAVDMLVFNDIDTGALSAEQRRVLSDWVAQGGHLVVTGGPNWQATAAGLEPLLPLLPENSATLSDLFPLADWLRLPDERLAAQTVIATGTLRPGAQILVDAAAVPLIARRSLGGGTVDYLVFDPNTQPVRGWRGLRDLWFALATTVNPLPGWQEGVYNWEQAASAANVMPGVNLLPDILPLCGFLAVYIALIGPVNYVVLNRLNRRELAWVTIPLLIAVFSALSWLIGSSLRGTEVTVSRITLVQSWPDAERAHAEEMLGLLSPRRDQYSLELFNESLLRPVPRAGGQGSLLSGGVLASADVQQTDSFRAADFPVDASFIAVFNATAFIDRPDISGQARLFYDDINGQQIVRGSVRNNTGEILHDPVILARGVSLRLDSPLAPGEVATFDLTLPGEGLPAPASVAYAHGTIAPIFGRTYSYLTTAPPSLLDILQTTSAEWAYVRRPVGRTPPEQDAHRRRLFLSSVISDPYNLTTGRGYRVYLAGWTDTAPLAMELEGSPWTSLDATLYLVQLETDMQKPSGEAVVTADQFTWVSEKSSVLDPIAPFSIVLEPGAEALFRFTPLPEAVLRQVREMTIRMDRGATATRTVPLYIWDWERDAWDELELTSSNLYTLRSPERYLGPQNAVQLRLVADIIGGFPRIQELTVEQRGRF